MKGLLVCALVKFSRLKKPKTVKKYLRTFEKDAILYGKIQK